jgi:tetratricopeptide (TPR) repeat protein
MHLKDPEKAEEAFRWTLALEEPVVTTEPGLTWLVRDACMRACCLAMMGNPQEALDAAERILARDPTRPLAMHTVASLLTEHPDPARRQPERALKLATATVVACERALNANPRHEDARVVAACMWNTLGLARLRSGDHAGAIEAVRRQMEIGNPEPIADWLVLALAHALRGEAGDAEEAERWFEKARTWRKTEPTPRKDMLRIYAEVEAALK